MNNRRSLFAAAALLVAPVAVAQGVAVTATPSPDAELIELCDHYITALDAYAACSNRPDTDHDPLWQYIESIEAKLKPLEPTTMAGVVAMAKVAQCWARQPDGSLDFSPTYTGDWPEFVVLAVLRIAGGQA